MLNYLIFLLAMTAIALPIEIGIALISQVYYFGLWLGVYLICMTILSVIWVKDHA